MANTTYTNDIYGVQQQIADEQAKRELDNFRSFFGGGYTKRAGMMYHAAGIGERQGNMYAGLGRMLTGEEEAVDPRMARMQKLESIMEQVPEPDTYDEYIQLAGLMNQAGLYGEAQEAMKMANEIRSSMAAAAKKTDFQSNYEYVMDLPEDKRDQAMQLWKPAASTDDWSDYLKTDTTPTGAEYLEYMNSQGVDATQTTDWKNYSNTTDTPTKPGFALWIDRNQKLQTFANAETLELSLLYANPAFLVSSGEERQTLIDAINLKYQDIKTFTQNGVVYDAHTKTAMLEGSKEIIPTTIVGGRVYDARTMTLLNDTGVKRVMKLRADKQWYYEDNGMKVFANDVTSADPVAEAEIVYQDYLKDNEEKFNTPEGKVELAKLLIQKGLAGTDIFADIMSDVNQDGQNAIQQENMTVKSIERLGESFVKSGVGTMDSILTPLEDMISDNMTQVRRSDGKIFWTGDLPGWGLVKKAVTYIPGEKGYEAREFAGRAMSLINTVLKQRSGAAVTESEWKRLQDEYATGITTAAQFASWVTRVRDYTEKTRMNVMGAYQPIVVNRYMANQGIYTVLDNPDDPVQRNQIPINGFYQDKNGTIYQRTE